MADTSKEVNVNDVEVPKEVDAGAEAEGETKAAPPPEQPDTRPVDESRRVKDEDIRIEMCTPDDAEKIAEGIYSTFAPQAWDLFEPPAIREPDMAKRIKRMGTRLRPTIGLEGMSWVKAVYVPTGEIASVAGWIMPGMPVCNILLQSAGKLHGYREKMGWSDEDIEEMWKGVDVEKWEYWLGKDDDIRREVMKGEDHWFLAPLLTFPAFQGRGVATKLMNWAIEQADSVEPAQPMYLESSKMARGVYLRFGFEPVGDRNMVRRGKKGVGGKVTVEAVPVEAVRKGNEE